MGLPVLRALSFMYVLPPVPRCSDWASSSLVSPSRISLPRNCGRVGLHIVLFEACSAFTRVAARTLAPSPIRDALHRRLQPFRHLHDCSGCFRLERSPGGARTHWKAPPSHGAHGYAAYASLAGDKKTSRKIRLAFCLVHARRNFVDVHKTTNSPFAKEVIERIAAVYAIEKRIRGLDADQRRAVRQAETKPLMEALKARLEATKDGISRKSTLVGAIDYALERWSGLSCSFRVVQFSSL